MSILAQRVVVGNKEYMDDKEAVREGLADYAHEAWSRTVEGVLSACEKTPDGLVIPGYLVKQLHQLIDTPYAKLAEINKSSDREEADKMLKVING